MSDAAAGWEQSIAEQAPGAVAAEARAREALQLMGVPQPVSFPLPEAAQPQDVEEREPQAGRPAWRGLRSEHLLASRYERDQSWS